MSTLIPPPSQDEIGKALNYYLDGMSREDLYEIAFSATSDYWDTDKDECDMHVADWREHLEEGDGDV
jgi:hypothetical protein